MTGARVSFSLVQTLGTRLLAILLLWRSISGPRDASETPNLVYWPEGCRLARESKCADMP